MALARMASKSDDASSTKTLRAFDWSRSGARRWNFAAFQNFSAASSRGGSEIVIEIFRDALRGFGFHAGQVDGNFASALNFDGERNERCMLNDIRPRWPMQVDGDHAASS